MLDSSKVQHLSKLSIFLPGYFGQVNYGFLSDKPFSPCVIFASYVAF
jgi:hypothetical protein